MKLNKFRFPSLKAKVMLMTLVIVVISIGLLVSSISVRMREDIKEVLGEQQMATASLAAAELNSGFQDRFDALRLVAKTLDSRFFDRPESVQQLVEDRLILRVLFNAGVFVTRSDGTAMAEFPRIGRVGLNYMDRDHVAAALTQGKSTVGKPVIGKRVRAPSFAMTVPISDDSGKVIGALSGATDLSQSNFLGNVNAGRYGKKGGYFIVDTAHRLVVTATDQTRVMTQLRPPGENPVMDRRLQGFDGPAINVNALGVEILSCAGRIPAAGWFLVAALPTQEAFAPIDAMQQHVLEITIVITALACCVVWLMMSGFLRRQFAPMIFATRDLDELSATQAPLTPLPVTGKDEVGALIGAFNRLLINLGQREDSLKKSEHLLRDAQQAAKIGCYITSLETGVWECTPVMNQLFGITEDYAHTIEGWVDFMHPDFSQPMNDYLRMVIKDKKPFDTEYKMRRPSDGAERWMHGLGQIAYDANGKAVSLIGTVQDITERKLKDLRLLENMREIRLREQALSQISQGVLISGADRLTTYINDEFVRITGYAREEMLGKPCSILQGPDSQPDVVLQMREALDAKQPFHGEILNYRKDGTPFWNDLSINPVFDEAGNVTQFVGIQRDVTQRKKMLEDLNLFRKCIDQANDVIVITEAEPFELPGPRIVFVNDAYERTTGYTREEALGATPRMLQGPKTDPAAIKRMAQALRQWKPVREEVLNYTKNGREFWSEIDIVPMANETGWYTHWISIQRDITERKLAEEAQRIAAIAFDSQQGMFITDSNRVILRVNRVFTKVTGYTSEEAVGQSPSLLKSGRQGAAFYVEMWDSIKRSGTWQGEIWNRRKNGTVYPQHLNISTVKDDAGLLTHYVGAFSDITATKAAEDQIHDLAYTDMLTGLPNRRLLIVRLQQAIAAAVSKQHQAALFLVDLDHFKNLNDSLGHNRGDEVLKRIAKRLSALVREGDTVARLGGDEFAVLLERVNMDSRDALNQTEAVARKMLEAISKPYQLADSQVSCTASIGITFFGSQHEETLEPMKRGELAMYQAKADGRNMMRFFEEQMQAVVDARVMMEADLRDAIRNKCFSLCYQAQFSDSEGFVGAEALLRWPDPKRGMVSPAEFIPLAEETGLILPLGDWVLETACQQLAAWADVPAMAHLTVAVNVSARQFRENNFVEQVLATLKRTGASAHRLKIELTESVLISEVEDVIAKMTALGGMGVGFAIDDFGTGYSSMAYLKRLPLEQLKIDQGFIRDILVDPDDAAIARAVIAMAASMGLGVIAEGVETEAQRDLLASLGCHNYQGYLFSRPLPVEEFEAFVSRA